MAYKYPPDPKPKRYLTDEEYYKPTPPPPKGEKAPAWKAKDPASSVPWKFGKIDIPRTNSKASQIEAMKKKAYGK